MHDDEPGVNNVEGLVLKRERLGDVHFSELQVVWERPTYNRQLHNARNMLSGHTHRGGIGFWSIATMVA